ncbi:hypothetical protein FNT36_03260 [Hymenobacter setariae]|uniref:Uncharacterized protein n=1 Tax=Hymenobacter setariae TaxID=2594794 RepID=A0A558C2U9_9BACT|nr:hypothetical protein [Hymenobacter setariae]TVT43125.1 hypothetical protein FNT36_03260 [Hymenobacter setariae]
MHADTIKELQQAVAPIQTSVAGLQTVVGTNESGVPVNIDDRFRVALGQDFPVLPEGQTWPMSSRSNYFAIQLLKAQFATLNETVNNTFPALSLRLEQTESALAALQAQQDADDLAEVAQDAYAQQTRALALAADAKAVAAQATADAAKAANLLTDAKAAAALSAAAVADGKAVAVQAKADADATATALLQARLTTDEAAIAAAQAKAEQALAAAQAAQTTANTAQAKADADAKAAADAQLTANQALALATTASNTAASAQTAATNAQASATTAINNAAAAQTTATAAQAATTALAAKFREKRVPTNQMALGATITQVVTWDTPFSDDKYSPIAELTGSGVLGLRADVLSWTAATVTVQIKNTLGLVLVAGAGTLIITAKHD